MMIDRVDELSILPIVSFVILYHAMHSAGIIFVDRLERLIQP